jgi:hypothetical protein
VAVESVIDAAPVDLAAAAAIEAAEMRAWADIYGAAPAEWAESVGLGTRELNGALVIRWAATGRRYFSRVIGLGVTEPAREAAIDEIIRGYEEAGITMPCSSRLRTAGRPSTRRGYAGAGSSRSTRRTVSFATAAPSSRLRRGQSSG